MSEGALKDACSSLAALTLLWGVILCARWAVEAQLWLENKLRGFAHARHAKHWARKDDDDD